MRLAIGLVESRPRRASMYALSARPQVLDVLIAAERLLAASGDAVVLYPTYGEKRRRHDESRHDGAAGSGRRR